MTSPVLLVLRALGLGDLLTGVPALRGLRRAFRRHELVLAAPAPLAPLAQLIGVVNRVLPTPAFVRGPIDALPPGTPRPDLAVNLHGRGPQSHRALMALDPGRLLAFACPSAGFLDGPQWTIDEHEVWRWCRMLSCYGVRADPADLRLAKPPPRPGWDGAALLHPGASEPERCWPVDRFAAVALQLRAEGLRVLVSGVGAERSLAVAVARAAGLPGDAVLAGRTDIGALSALVAHASVVVCGDTGVAHLATAFGTPSVVLFGPMTPRWWGPPGSARHAVLWHGPSGLAKIEVDEVLEAARTVRGDAVTAG